MPRQQRRNSARGAVPFRKLGTRVDLMWSITSVSGADVVITIATPQAGQFLAGIPEFIIADTGDHATNATIAADVMTITFPNPVPANFTLELAPNDPAFRTPQAGYLCGGLSSWTTPVTPAPTPLVVSGVDILNTSATCTIMTDAAGWSCGLPAAEPDGDVRVVGCPVTALAGGNVTGPGGTSQAVIAGALWSFTRAGGTYAAAQLI